MSIAPASTGPGIKTRIEYDDTPVRQFMVASIFWGIIGMLVGVLIATQLGVCSLSTPHGAAAHRPLIADYWNRKPTSTSSAVAWVASAHYSTPPPRVAASLAPWSRSPLLTTPSDRALPRRENEPAARRRAHASQFAGFPGDCLHRPREW